MPTPTRSNTIDFDAAKLQRLGFAGKRRPSPKPVSLGELRRQLNLQLQTSLEAERILGLFFQEVQRLVPLDALCYQHSNDDLRIELGQRAPHSAAYRLSHDGQYLGDLTFRRALRFDEGELAQLETLLSCLLFPLRNALLYREAVLSALRDPLTQTGNRIAMNQALQREVDIAKRSSKIFTQVSAWRRKWRMAAARMCRLRASKSAAKPDKARTGDGSGLVLCVPKQSPQNTVHL